MKIVATMIFEGQPEAWFTPEWEAQVEGISPETGPSGWGSSEQAAIADLKDNYCPCACSKRPDPHCDVAGECQHTWDDDE